MPSKRPESSWRHQCSSGVVLVQSSLNCQPRPPMSNILITGANRGIGLALTRLYRDRGDSVVAVCRQSSNELDALGVRVESGVDVTDRESLTDLARRLSGVDIEVLIKNAGVM